MIAIDTNILFPLVVQDHPQHSEALAFAESLQNRSDVAVSELVLLELYNLLRNPTVMTRPLSASAAVDVCEAFRQHPFWQTVGFPPKAAPSTTPSGPSCARPTSPAAAHSTGVSPSASYNKASPSSPP